MLSDYSLLPKRNQPYLPAVRPESRIGLPLNFFDVSRRCHQSP
jgi:hypothetical protein